MRIPPSHRVLILSTLALLSACLTAHAQTGARVYLQAWNPLNPEQTQVVTLLDEPGLVSDSLQDAWTRARPVICKQLRDRMGVGGAAHGETLSAITCLLDETPALEVTSTGVNTLRARFSVGGYVEATSTTPDVFLGIGLGEYADPRFSVALTARFELTINVQASREQTLHVSKATFSLSNAVLDSHNFSGDMLKFVAGELVPFFGGTDYRNLAESAINSVSVDVANQFNAALTDVNAKLVGPTGVIRAGVAARDHYVNVAFGPAPLTPPANGSISGIFRWDPTTFTPRHGCQSFTVRASVQTGPAPMFPGNVPAPVQPMGQLQTSPRDANSCNFTLTGIANGWPNKLESQVLDPPVLKNDGKTREVYALAPEGWSGAQVNPQPALSDRNYLVRAMSMKTPHVSDTAQLHSRDDLINPEINRTYTENPASSVIPQANGKRLNDAVVNRRDAVKLNPQPLPPQEIPAQAKPKVIEPGEQSAKPE